MVTRFELQPGVHLSKTYTMTNGQPWTEFRIKAASSVLVHAHFWIFARHSPSAGNELSELTIHRMSEAGDLIEMIATGRLPQYSGREMNHAPATSATLSATFPIVGGRTELLRFGFRPHFVNDAQGNCYVSAIGVADLS
jgi:hypothetical protein